MYRSQNSNLKRRIEALEKSPASQPLPEPPDCAGVIKLVAGLTLDVAHLEALRDMAAARQEGVQRVPDWRESEACDALRAALELETRRAAFTDFAEYERACSEFCLRRIPVRSTGDVEFQIACQVTEYRFSHGAPMVPEGWEIPKGWTKKANGIWAAKCKSLFRG